jgi:2-phospho-L-lactate/phosphoenolpyruvate guanylyltransferase
MDDPRPAALLPVKAFGAAKVRLADALDVEDRANLARSMAETVVRAAAPMPVFIACDDPGVAEWAESVGATVLPTPGLGLTASVQHGVDTLASLGYSVVLVAHADLPHAANLASLCSFPGVTLVPDRRDDGTNVIVVPSRAGFVFSYGPESFVRHIAAAQALGLPLRIARRPELAWDVDTPDDLPLTTPI